MRRAERQAQVEHPKLYALQQHGVIRLLGNLFWTPRAQKVARKHARAMPRAYQSYAGAMTPRTIVVHIHEGAIVRF